MRGLSYAKNQTECSKVRKRGLLAGDPEPESVGWNQDRQRSGQVHRDQPIRTEQAETERGLYDHHRPSVLRESSETKPGGGAENAWVFRKGYPKRITGGKHCMSEFELQDKEVISMVRRNPRRKVCADALPPIEFLDDGTVRFARKKFPWRVLIRAGCIVLGITQQYEQRKS